ncbi:unnamed protein product [Ranitomeya imitator]|uniref:Peptidase M12B domain-containing protein n=1 Tax=Ranitomeya imitator TaxID=111125 RepID=A0ABN9L042_9NEOB|nr:unnamed protein product [Ranitomeya imitator]
MISPVIWDFIDSSGIQFDTTGLTEADFFKFFFSEELINLMVAQTNLGYITIGGETYSIDPGSSGSSDHVITLLHNKHRPMADSHQRQQRSLRSVIREGQRQIYNIELFLVADQKEYQRHGADLEKTRHHLISVAHHLNQILSRINFQVFLVGVEIWTQENKAVVSEKASTTLQRFLQWRTEDVLPRKHHDNIQLISGAHFKNHALGEAYLAKMCTETQSGGVIKDTGVGARELAKYIAHEMGHNLGMSHDTEHCYCPVATGKCLLSQRTGHNMNEMFSDCSHRALHRFLEEKDIACLMDRPRTYIDEPMLHSEPMETLETIGEGLHLPLPRGLLRGSDHHLLEEETWRDDAEVMAAVSPVRSCS